MGGQGDRLLGAVEDRNRARIGRDAPGPAYILGNAFLEPGILGTINSDGWPELTPLNFVYHNDCLYFHGSVAGQKMKNMKADHRVTFAVAKEYAIVPSSFTNPELACPATAFFKSVLIKGDAEVLTDLTEKAEALSAFMRKLQPEGGYDPIEPENPAYTGQIKSTSVVRITVHELSAKYKFG